MGSKIQNKLKVLEYDRNIVKLLDYESKAWNVDGKKDFITEDEALANHENVERMLNFFIAYPDRFIDYITPEDSNFKLFFYQRIFLRVCMRHRYVFSTFTRAFSKSFLAILVMFLRCVFLPNSKVFVTTKVKEQAAKIAREKLDEIFTLWPILKKEIYRGRNSPMGKNSLFEKDYIELHFRNNSIFTIVGMANSSRGGRRHAGIIEEVRDIDGDIMNEVIIPMMNITRRDASGRVNPREPHQAQLFVTTAGEKSTYAYEKNIDLLVNSVIHPDDYFVWAGTYEIPIMHGLLDPGYIDEIKLDATYNDESFAREYLSIWTGGGKDAFFDYDRMLKYRKIVKSETTYSITRDTNKNDFYVAAVDVARLSAQTVITIFRIHMLNDFWVKNEVNIIVMDQNNMHFSSQANVIKKVAQEYQLEHLVIDGAGLGVGLLDFLTMDTLDEKKGIVWGAIGTYNDDHYLKTQPPGVNKIIYVMKSNEKADQIHLNALTQITTGKVHFLITDREAKVKLMATKKGRAMTSLERSKILLPYQLTTIQHEEMANLRAKKTTSRIILEQINRNIGKDKFSSLEYALWVIKELESEYFKNKHKENRKLGEYLLLN